MKKITTEGARQAQWATRSGRRWRPAPRLRSSRSCSVCSRRKWTRWWAARRASSTPLRRQWAIATGRGSRGNSRRPVGRSPCGGRACGNLRVHHPREFGCTCTIGYVPPRRTGCASASASVCTVLGNGPVMAPYRDKLPRRPQWPLTSWSLRQSRGGSSVTLATPAIINACRLLKAAADVVADGVAGYR